MIGGGPTLVHLLALAVPVVPGLLWLILFYRTDRYEPEPKRLVALTFLLGVLAILPAFGGELLVDAIHPYLGAIQRATAASDAASIAIWPLLAACFFVVGPLEELSKFLAVRLFIYRNPEFDEPLDGIIYAAAAALGFASLENVFYVIDFRHGWTIRWGMLGARAFLALPGHVIFAATWGYALGRRKFDPSYRVWPSLLVAVGLHGLYDFLLLYPRTRPLIVLYMALMIPVVVRQIRILREASPFSPAALAARAAAGGTPPL